MRGDGEEKAEGVSKPHDHPSFEEQPSNPNSNQLQRVEKSRAFRVNRFLCLIIADDVLLLLSLQPFLRYVILLFSSSRQLPIRTIKDK